MPRNRESVKERRNYVTGTRVGISAENFLDIVDEVSVRIQILLVIWILSRGLRRETKKLTKGGCVKKLRKNSRVER